MKMSNENLSGDGLGKRRRRRKRRLGASGVTLVGRKRKGRKGRKICIRTKAGSKVCGTRWRRRRRK
jgi:hypothetical protein